MLIEKLVKNKKNLLYKKYNSIRNKILKRENKLNNDKNEYHYLYEFLSYAYQDIGNIRNYDLDFINEILLSRGIEIINSEDLRLIKITLLGKYDKGLDIDLSTEQKEKLNNYLKKINSFINKLKKIFEETNTEIIELKVKLDELEDKYLELEDIYDRINNPKNNDILTENDFQLIYSLMDELPSYEEKKNVLLEFRQYNLDRINNVSKEKNSKVNIDDVKKLFESYKCARVVKYIDKNREEVSNNANIDNMKEILEYMSYEGFIYSFEPASLLSICIYGSLDSVKERYEELSNNNNLEKLFFDVPSVWVDNISKTRKKKRTPTTIIDKQNNGDVSLSSLAHSISYEEILENEKFLKSKGFNISIENRENIKTLKTPHYKILENYEIYSIYGFFDVLDKSDFPASAFAFSSVKEKCDKLIELGLLNGPKNKDDAYSNYTKHYPTIISALKNEIYMILYLLKSNVSIDEYYETIFSSHRFGTLSGDLTRNELGYKLNSSLEVDQFENANFINKDKEIESSNDYENAILNSDNISYSSDILLDPLIKNLEDNYRVDDNEFIYNINGVIISRLKVLRNYSILNENNLNVNEALLYSIIRGSYLNGKAFDKIKSCIITREV